jgi:hypothetical protein
MIHPLKKQAIWSGMAFLACMLLLAAAQIVQAAAPAGDEGPTCFRPYKLFAPVILKSPTIMVGKVTYLGAPVPDQLLELRLYHDGKYDTLASAVSDANGDYQLTVPVDLKDDPNMYLRWLNPTGNDAWLSSWFCKNLEGSITDHVTCSFDIQDVVLIANPASVTLPFTFQWEKRAAAGDSYQHDLLDPANPYRWSHSDPLGYVDSYLLSRLSYHFSVNKAYAWGVTVYGPDGSGKSFYTNPVTFTNRGVKAPKASSPGPQLRNNLPLDPPPP